MQVSVTGDPRLTGVDLALWGSERRRLDGDAESRASSSAHRGLRPNQIRVRRWGYTPSVPDPPTALPPRPPALGLRNTPLPRGVSASGTERDTCALRVWPGFARGESNHVTPLLKTR